MDFTNWRFPRPSSCKYQFLEMDLSPTPKWPEPNSIMDFKRDGFWIQQAKNQEERPSEVENITIFPKPVIRRKLWKDWEINSANNLQTKNTQPRQLPHDQRHPEDTSNYSEEPYIILSYTNKHWNKRIFISGNLPFSDSILLGGFKDQRLFPFQPEDTKINLI